MFFYGENYLEDKMKTTKTVVVGFFKFNLIRNYSYFSKILLNGKVVTAVVRGEGSVSE